MAPSCTGAPSRESNANSTMLTATMLDAQRMASRRYRARGSLGMVSRRGMRRAEEGGPAPYRRAGSIIITPRSANTAWPAACAIRSLGKDEGEDDVGGEETAIVVAALRDDDRLMFGAERVGDVLEERLTA